MNAGKMAPETLAANSLSADETNARQRPTGFNGCDLGSEQRQIADIQAGLQEADQGEFASAQEVRAVFAKYGH